MAVQPKPPSLTRVALLLGTLVSLTVIGSSAVAVALPVVRAELALDRPGTAWVMAVFSLAFAVTTAIFGRVADLHGLRVPLRIGVVLFAGGSIAAAMAANFPSLIAGRLLQGAGAGAVPVLALGVLASRYEGVARGRALGALTAVVSIVSGSGPLIGGSITQLLGWRYVLAIPALALLILEPVARLAPSDRPTAGGSVDWSGAVFVACFTTGVVLLLQAPATKAGPLLVGGAAILAVVGVVATRAHVRRHPEGFLPRRILRNRDMVLTSLAGMTLLAAYLGMILALPLILADRGWRPLDIGLAMLPAALTGAVVSRVVGGVAQRLGRYRVVMWLGIGSAIGLVVAALFSAVPALMILGFAGAVAGFAGGQVALIDGVAALVDEDVQGVALGVFNLVFFTGGAVGAAVVGGLGDVLSLPAALGCLAVLPLAGAAAAVVVDRRTRTGAPGLAGAVGDDDATGYRLNHQA